MLHTVESIAKGRSNNHFDAVSSAICQFCKSPPVIPVMDVYPIEESPYKLIRYVYGASFITIRTIGRKVEISIHKKYTLDVPNDLYVDQELVAEVKHYLSKSLTDVKWSIKQSRSK